MILSAYQSRCLITGINLKELLVASHIIPWSKNEMERLNPENGLCLSNLYDKAFDKGFIGITIDHKVVLSKRIKKQVNENFYEKFFGNLDGFQVQFNGKYRPKKEFLEYHLDEIFDK